MKKWTPMVSFFLGSVIGIVAGFLVFLLAIWLPAAKALENHIAVTLLNERAQMIYNLQLYDTILQETQSEGEIEKVRKIVKDRKKSTETTIKLIDMSLAALKDSSSVNIKELDQIKNDIERERANAPPQAQE